MSKRFGKQKKGQVLKDPFEKFGPFHWDGKKTICGMSPKVEINSFVKVTSLPEDEKTGDPLGFVPETVAMVGGSYEVLTIKIMIHPRTGREFIYGLHYLEQNRVQYFWPWNIEEDTGR